MICLLDFWSKPKETNHVYEGKIKEKNIFRISSIRNDEFSINMVSLHTDHQYHLPVAQNARYTVDKQSGSY